MSSYLLLNNSKIEDIYINEVVEEQTVLIKFKNNFIGKAYTIGLRTKIIFFPTSVQAQN